MMNPSILTFATTSTANTSMLPLVVNLTDPLILIDSNNAKRAGV